MQLRDIMNRNVAALMPETPLREVVQRMSTMQVRLLPVCEAGKLVGLVTLRDLIVRATAQGCDPKTSTVREVMTREVVYGRMDQDVQSAAALMRRYRLARLPVLDRHDRLVGIVSQTDLRKANWSEAA